MHRGRLRLVSFERRGSRHQLPVTPAHRFLQAGGGLAGGGGERNPAGCDESEIEEQGHDGRCDGGLAGAGTARYHADPAANRGPGRHPDGIVGRGIGKEPVELDFQRGRIEPCTGRRRNRPARRAVSSGGMRGIRHGAAFLRLRSAARHRRSLVPPRTGRHVHRKTTEAGRDRPLRRPEALEIEPATVVEDQRTSPGVFRSAHHRARTENPDPCIEFGEPHRARPRPFPARDVGQRDAGMSVPGPRTRERRRQRQLGSVAAIEVRDHRREVPVDVGEVALFEQLVHRRPRGDGARTGGSRSSSRTLSGRRRSSRSDHVPLPRKQSSRARRHAVDGRSKYTPRRVPAAGSMPRTKR